MSFRTSISFLTTLRGEFVCMSAVMTCPFGQYLRGQFHADLSNQHEHLAVWPCRRAYWSCLCQWNAGNRRLLNRNEMKRIGCFELWAATDECNFIATCWFRSARALSLGRFLTRPLQTSLQTRKRSCLSKGIRAAASHCVSLWLKGGSSRKVRKNFWGTLLCWGWLRFLVNNTANNCWSRITASFCESACLSLCNNSTELLK